VETVKFEGTVDEVDIFQVSHGQKANIIIDALPDKELTGTVTFVSPAGTGETGVVNYTITIELDPVDIELKGTLTATADLILDKADNVLIVPTSALNSTPEGDFATVLIDMETMQTEQRQVKTGIQSYQFAEITSGLKEGDKLLVGNY
jgi:macrolide-specific efflux system membrane fusion protein